MSDWQQEAAKIKAAFDVRRVRIVENSRTGTWPTRITGEVFIDKKRYYFQAHPCIWERRGVGEWQSIGVVIKDKYGDFFHQGVLGMAQNGPVQITTDGLAKKHWFSIGAFLMGRTPEEIEAGEGVYLTAHERLEAMLQMKEKGF